MGVGWGVGLVVLEGDGGGMWVTVFGGLFLERVMLCTAEKMMKWQLCLEGKMVSWRKCLRLSTLDEAGRLSFHSSKHEVFWSEVRDGWPFLFERAIDFIMKVNG